MLQINVLFVTKILALKKKGLQNYIVNMCFILTVLIVGLNKKK